MTKLLSAVLALSVLFAAPAASAEDAILTEKDQRLVEFVLMNSLGKTADCTLGEPDKVSENIYNAEFVCWDSGITQHVRISYIPTGAALGASKDVCRTWVEPVGSEDDFSAFCAVAPVASYMMKLRILL